MRTITLDMETYFDKEYSLSKMSTDDYIRDPRFQIIGISISVGDKAPLWFTDPIEVSAVIRAVPWADCAVRAHHVQFDGGILAHHFGVKPKLWMDTLAQARMVSPCESSHSLANVAKRLGLPDKGNAVLAAIGKRREDFTAQELWEYGQYCNHDAYLCREIGRAYDPLTPPLAAAVIDMVTRMFTEPLMVGNAVSMEQRVVDEVARKEALLADSGTMKDVIMSNPKLADLLRSYGVEPPMKLSAATKRETFAFAKTDKAFQALLEHEDPRVQVVTAARLGVKSTIAETRARKFAAMARRGPMPVYLKMWGAKTTGRLSGGDGLNWQNLSARGPSAGLRNDIEAPPGRVMLVGDSSNIELRVSMALAGQLDVVDKLRSGVDLYCDFASRLFGRTITKADKSERFLGKTAMLGLGYGAGAPRFQEMVRVAALADPDIQPVSESRAREIVDIYRNAHPRLVALWKRCQDVVLPDIANGCSMMNVDVNGWFITQRSGFGRPGEPGVMYKDLRYDTATGEWMYTAGREQVRIYGPKVVENMTQHASMLIVMWQTVRINRRFPVKLSVHDEAVTLPLIEELDGARTYMEECLSMAPPWCRGDVPVACETGYGSNYGSAK